MSAASGTMTYSLADVNAMSPQAFGDAFGDIAEHSPWVAQEAEKHRPFANRDAVVAGFEAAMRAAPEARQLDLIRAHPDLAGRAAIAGKLEEASKREQAGAGLDQMSAAEFERFNVLNDAYKARFGFPFILAVKGATKDQILASFERRVGNDHIVEFEMALTQIARIFMFRLLDRIRENP